MNNVKNQIQCYKVTHANNHRDAFSERQHKADPVNDYPYITIIFPYGIETKTLLMPHMTCEGLLRKANEIFKEERQKQGIEDGRAIIALESATKVESLDCYMTIGEK